MIEWTRDFCCSVEKYRNSVTACKYMFIAVNLLN